MSTKGRPKSETRRVGPPCNPENAPNGCGRPLPVSGIPKAEQDLAKLVARAEKLKLRLATAKGITVVNVAEEKAKEEAEKAARAAAKAAKEAEKAAATNGTTPA